MKKNALKEWMAAQIWYRFFGCRYNKNHDHIFDFVTPRIPGEFLGKHIIDIGCGDGTNTLRIKKSFRSKSITGLEVNPFLIERARKKGLSVRKFRFEEGLPEGELATFTFSLHHSPDMGKTLQEAERNFKLIFLCEPILDIYHRILDGGTPLPKKDWIALFDEVFHTYDILQYRNNLMVFHRSKKL